MNNGLTNPLQISISLRIWMDGRTDSTEPSPDAPGASESVIRLARLGPRSTRRTSSYTLLILCKIYQLVVS